MKIESRKQTDKKFIAHDGSYKAIITTGESVGDNDTASDGTGRPGAILQMDGLDDAENCSEIRLFRSFGEDDLRTLAKLFTLAANELRRIENARRRDKDKFKQQVKSIPLPPQPGA